MVRLDDLHGSAAALMISACMGLCVGAALLWAHYRHLRLQARARQLDTASQLLRQHNDNLASFLADPAAPVSMQKLLIWFNSAIADRQVARTLSIDLCSPPASRTYSRAHGALLEDLDRLSLHRKDLAGQFQDAIGYGVPAMFLIWDDLAPMFDQFMARIVTPRQQLELAELVSRSEQSVRQAIPAAA